jgi:long-chain acyl-CoA synthetase
MTTRFHDIPSLLASIAATPRDPRPALTFYVGRTRAGTVSYGELHDRVEAVAGHLQQALGIRRGDRIAVLAPNRLEVPVLVLGIMRIGAVLVPLNPAAPIDDWTYILAHARARACFATADLAAKLPAVEGLRVEHIEGMLEGIDANTGGAPLAAPAPDLGDAMAVILYTSGTTGRPKGVALAQRSLLANARSMAINFRLAGTTQFAVLPLYHAHAFGFGLMTALTTGGHLVFAERFDPFAWTEVIRAHDVAITSVVPTLLPALLQVRVTADRVPSLRAIMVSSAPLGGAFARDFESRTNIRLVQGWGLSEYTNFACCMPPDDEGERDHCMFAFEVPSVGCPLAGTEVRVVDAANRELPAGERGELCIRGHSTMLGYLEDPDATAKTVDADGWLHSGDEGFYTLLRDRRWFFVTGRIKEIIIRSGDKYSPLALERVVVTAIPELAGKLAILGFKHDTHGEEIGAYIEAEVDSGELRARLSSVLDAMTAEQRPKIVMFGAEPIPRTHTGKVQRRKLVVRFEPYAGCRGATRYV